MYKEILSFVRDIEIQATGGGGLKHKSDGGSRCSF